MRQPFSLRDSLCAVFLIMFFVLAARPARAEGFIAPFAGFSFGGEALNCANLATCEQRRANWGISLGTAHGIFGFEEDISYVPQFHGRTPNESSAMLTIASNMMVRLPSGLVRPYALVGVAFIRPHATLDAAGLGYDKTVIGYDLGGGVTLFTDRHVGVRSDVRRIRSLKDASFGAFSTEHVEYWRGSVGLSFRF